MDNKTFIVSPAGGVSPLHIKGKTLEDALHKAKLDPAIWLLVTQPESPPEANFGKDS